MASAQVELESPKPSPRLHEGATNGRVLLVEEEEAVLSNLNGMCSLARAPLSSRPGPVKT